VHIPKGPGKTRPLGIAAVKDRIVQTAITMVVEPIFEREFLPSNDGFRPGRGCKDALREVERWLKRGYTWVVDADLESYFDSVAYLGAADNVSRLLPSRLSDVNQPIIRSSKPAFKTSSRPLGLPLSTPQPFNATIINWHRCLDRLRLWPWRHAEHQYFSQAPDMIGESSRHRWRARPPPLG
jgi:hypothetical protein